MKNNPTTPVTSATGHSKTSARLKRTIVTFTRWWSNHEIDIFLIGSLMGGITLFLMCMRAISGA